MINVRPEKTGVLHISHIFLACCYNHTNKFFHILLKYIIGNNLLITTRTNNLLIPRVAAINTFVRHACDITPDKILFVIINYYLNNKFIRTYLFDFSAVVQNSRINIIFGQLTRSIEGTYIASLDANFTARARKITILI